MVKPVGKAKDFLCNEVVKMNGKGLDIRKTAWITGVFATMGAALSYSASRYAWYRLRAPHPVQLSCYYTSLISAVSLAVFGLYCLTKQQFPKDPSIARAKLGRIYAQRADLTAAQIAQQAKAIINVDTRDFVSACLKEEIEALTKDTVFAFVTKHGGQNILEQLSDNARRAINTPLLEYLRESLESEPRQSYASIATNFERNGADKLVNVADSLNGYFNKEIKSLRIEELFAQRLAKDPSRLKALEPYQKETLLRKAHQELEGLIAVPVDQRLLNRDNWMKLLAALGETGAPTSLNIVSARDLHAGHIDFPTFRCQVPNVNVWNSLDRDGTLIGPKAREWAAKQESWQKVIEGIGEQNLYLLNELTVVQDLYKRWLVEQMATGTPLYQLDTPIGQTLGLSQFLRDELLLEYIERHGKEATYVQMRKHFRNGNGWTIAPPSAWEALRKKFLALSFAGMYAHIADAKDLQVVKRIHHTAITLRLDLAIQEPNGLDVLRHTRNPFLDSQVYAQVAAAIHAGRDVIEVIEAFHLSEFCDHFDPFYRTLAEIKVAKADYARVQEQAKQHEQAAIKQKTADFDAITQPLETELQAAKEAYDQACSLHKDAVEALAAEKRKRKRLQETIAGRADHQEKLDLARATIASLGERMPQSEVKLRGLEDELANAKEHLAGLRKGLERAKTERNAAQADLEKRTAAEDRLAKMPTPRVASDRMTLAERTQMDKYSAASRNLESMAPKGDLEAILSAAQASVVKAEKAFRTAEATQAKKEREHAQADKDHRQLEADITEETRIRSHHQAGVAEADRAQRELARMRPLSLRKCEELKQRASKAKSEYEIRRDSLKRTMERVAEQLSQFKSEQGNQRIKTIRRAKQQMNDTIEQKKAALCDQIRTQLIQPSAPPQHQ